MRTCNATDRPGRRRARGAVALLGVCLLALNLMALIGLLARDRSVLLAILLYLRLLPLGGAAIAFDLTRRGRGIGKPRFLLAAIGLITVACSGWEMIGRGPEVPTTPRARPKGEVRLLHWNVLWGGGRRRNQARWGAIVDDIQRRRPDVVVLSEAPPEPWITSPSRRMGAAWSAVKVEHAPRSHYWYRLVVLSRWPVRKQRLVSTHNGVALAVTVDQPGRPIRILVVGGHSTITPFRTPMLHDVAQACRRAATAGTPFDLVAGDFNAVARSVGFDALGAVAGGYTLAAHASTGWRTTWPVPLPLYDIDHVWVRHGLPILSCDLFAYRAATTAGSSSAWRWGTIGVHQPGRFDPPGSNGAVGAVIQPGR